MDTVILGNLVDVHSGMIYPAELSIKNGKIKKINPVKTKQAHYIVPGFIDSHIHIESSLLTPENFAHVALSHGTIATVSDPHEIANVCGIEGVEFMISNGNKSKIKFFWTAPSCVPATSFETSGATLGAEALNVLFENKKIVALGEMMNYPGVIFGDKEVWEKCRVAQKYNRVLDGHAPGLTGRELKSYVAAGISTDHECSTLKEALEKINLGMKILIREGSSAKNFDALYTLLNTNPDCVMLCSDDLHADDLMKGHMNLLVKRSVEKGVPLMNVLRSVSLMPVKHYNLPVGLLRENDEADFVIVDNLEEFSVMETWINGEKVYEKGSKIHDSGISDNVINHFNASPVKHGELDFLPLGAMARVMEVSEGSISTKERVLNVGNDFNSFLENNKLLKLFVKDRYRDTFMGKALVSGFGAMEGAIASTIAHDSHNLIVLGSSSAHISEAVNMLIENRGGIAFVSDKVREILPLPVAGLMSDNSAKDVSDKYERIIALANQHGCILKSPLMTLSFLALLVIPELKLSDRGLFDVRTFKFTDIFFD